MQTITKAGDIWCANYYLDSEYYTKPLVVVISVKSFMSSIDRKKHQKIKVYNIANGQVYLFDVNPTQDKKIYCSKRNKISM